MNKIKWMLCFVILFLGSVAFAQENKVVSAEELLPMYRTWVKILLFVIVGLSISLLIVGLKYYKLRQENSDKISKK